MIGDLPLERLNVGHVEQVLAAVPGSAGTRHRVLATLRAALNAAAKQRQITWNPDHVSKRFGRLAAEAGVPPIKLHEGGRHSANSLMRDAGWTRRSACARSATPARTSTTAGHLKRPDGGQDR